MTASSPPSFRTFLHSRKKLRIYIAVISCSCPFPVLLQPHPSTDLLSVSGFASSKPSTWRESCNRWLVVTGFFHLTSCFQGAFILEHEWADGLYHSHSNMGAYPRLWPTPQLMALPDPWPTDPGQGSNPHPHVY